MFFLSLCFGILFVIGHLVVVVFLSKSSNEIVIVDLFYVCFDVWLIVVIRVKV